MKAVLIEESTTHLYIGETKEPEIGDEDLLVSVKATALNRADLLQRKGKYPPPEGTPNILGLEMSGIIEKVGQNASDWKIGDRVCALLPGGGYAEKVVIPADMAIPIPDNFSFEEAAAIPEAYLTAYLNLSVLGQVSIGDYVLIHAGASGIGTAAIQLVREMKGIPIVTAGSRRKLDVCKTLGANYLINYKEGDFSNRVREITSSNGVEVILDPVGASYWEQNLKCIAAEGRWLVIGGLGGYDVENINLQELLRRRIHLIGSSLRTRTAQNKIELTRDFTQFAQERLSDGRLVPVIDRVFSWQNVMEAHQYMEQNKNIGKIVLSIDKT